MLLSFNWLKQYVKLPDSVTPEEVAEKLKLSTVEVEGIKYQGAGLDNVVVGKVLSCEKHPNADKLKVCQVDIGVGAENFQPSRSGSHTVQVVCGGSNVVEGMLTAVAKVGAKVKWHGEGGLVELKPTAIRGVESQGMICGADEIGLEQMFPKKEEKEIVDLSVILTRPEAGKDPLNQTVRDSSVAAKLSQNDKTKPGTPLSVALGLSDTILEIDNKSLSNRPDLWGHYGMAREVAVLFNKKLEPYKTGKIKDLRFKIENNKEVKLTVEVQDEKLCPRYMAIAMSGIKVGESPAWLKQKLTAVGLRPINNIVDITNYVMYDLGQPMHAFDAKHLVNTKKQETNLKIIVRRARDGEVFTTLDEKKHTLNSEMLVIANEEKPIALAGVMGGLESGITGDTTTIVFESANFDAANVRKTSTKLGIRTDSSARFEKSLDPNLAETALKKAVELVLEVSPGAKVASKVADEGKPRLAVGPIEVPIEFFQKKIGIEIPKKTIVTTLERLGFTVEEKKQTLKIIIPTWRATRDITIAEDVVEEVVRIYGYDNIPSSLPVFPITPPEENKPRQLERQIAELLVRELAYTEVYNYSFVSAEQVNAFGEGVEKYLELDNPIAKDRPYLRRHLLNNLLENIKNNIDNYSHLQLFEIGKVFRADEAGTRAETNGNELLPRQDTWLTAVYVKKQDKEPFWAVRRLSEAVALALRINFTVAPPTESRRSQHPSRAAVIRAQNTGVGSFYELHPLVTERIGIEERVGVFKLNINALAEVYNQVKEGALYTPVLLYPEVVRDVAFIVKKEITHTEIVQAFSSTDPLIKHVELFDVFVGKGVGEGYKSMAYRITYAHPERTLTSEEVDAVEKKIKNVLEKQFAAEIRK